MRTDSDNQSFLTNVGHCQEAEVELTGKGRF